MLPVPRLEAAITKARWQSGHAAACKAVNAGSIPTLASSRRFTVVNEPAKRGFFHALTVFATSHNSLNRYPSPSIIGV